MIQEQFLDSWLKGVSVKKFCNLVKLDDITHYFFFLVRKVRTRY